MSVYKRIRYRTPSKLMDATIHRCPHIYEYGPVDDPDVYSEWKFEEPSGNIQDSVTGKSLTPNLTPDYNQSIAFPDGNCAAPGIQVLSPNGPGGIGEYFFATGTDSDYDIGTSDFKFDFIGMLDESIDDYANGGDVFSTHNSGVTKGYGFACTENTFDATLIADDGTIVSSGSTFTANPLTIGEIYKWELIGERAGGVDGIQFKINDELKGIFNIGPLVGKLLSAYNIYIGIRADLPPPLPGPARKFLGKLFYIRLQKNITNTLATPRSALMPGPYVHTNGT